MKKFSRVCLVLFLVLGLTKLASGQDQRVKAEFDCLLMANSSSRPLQAGEQGFRSFHHVWTPHISYGNFESNGLHLFYEAEGEGDETVIVLHGGPGLPHEYFHPGLSNLSRYARIVYFDRRADMLSSKSSFEMASVTELAEDVDALRKALNLNKVTLLGHSFGGAVALTYALRHPDNVKRLILVSSSAVLENPAEVEGRLLKSLSSTDASAYRSNEGSVAAGSVCDRVRSRYRLLYPSYFRQMPNAATLDRGTYTAYFDMLARRMNYSDNGKGFDVRAELSRINVPTLVIAGRHDLVTPLAFSEELAAGIQGSRLVVLDHSAHFPFLEENYLFTEWAWRFIMATGDRVNEASSVSATTKR